MACASWYGKPFAAAEMLNCRYQAFTKPPSKGTGAPCSPQGNSPKKCWSLPKSRWMVESRQYAENWLSPSFCIICGYLAHKRA
jgi:hypothetical protein